MFKVDDGANEVVVVGAERLASHCVETFAGKPVDRDMYGDIWNRRRRRKRREYLAAKKRNLRVVISVKPSSRKGRVSTCENKQSLRIIWIQSYLCQDPLEQKSEEYDNADGRSEEAHVEVLDLAPNRGTEGISQAKHWQDTRSVRV